MPPSASPRNGQDRPRPVVVGAIPARYGSTRLPGKALRLLAGKPLIEHVWRRASAARELDRVVVLTDDDRIARAVSGFGGRCEMTPADCTSGTDRIAWAARRWQADAVVNIQGDEPLMEPSAIDRLAEHLRLEPADPIVTLAAPADEEAQRSPEVVKVVVDRQGYALYFSRAPIPFPRRPGECPARRHIGIYGYRREALLRLAALEPTSLERAESLEQLRALENGISIRVLDLEWGWSGVDTMEDLERVEQLIARGARGA